MSLIFYNSKKFNPNIIFSLQLILFIIGLAINKFQDVSRPITIIISFLFLITAMCFRKNNNYSKYVSIAMTFCFLGDVVLAGYVSGGKLIGIIMFAIAHIFFIVAYISSNSGRIFNKGFYRSIIVYCIYFTILWLCFLKTSPFGMLFAIATLIYGFLVAIMASFAVSLYFNEKQYIKTAIGALLFLISDSVIALTQKQSFIIPYSHIIIWTTYIIALYCIIYSGQFITEN